MHRDTWGKELKEAMGLMEHSVDTIGPRCSYEWLANPLSPATVPHLLIPPP